MLSDVKAELTGQQAAHYEDMISQCAKDYACADAFIQLPGCTPLPKDFSMSKVHTAPLVSRLPQRSARDVRSELGIPDHVHVLVLCFGGGHSHTYHLREEALPKDWVCVMLDGSDRETSKHLAGLSKEKFFSVSADYYIPDLIHIADCVLGKVGYGFVSECVSCRTPLVYISRTHWAEEEYLRDYLHSCRMGVPMQLSDFDAGAWDPSLQSALALRAQSSTKTGPCWNNLDAADEICSIVRRISMQRIGIECLWDVFAFLSSPTKGYSTAAYQKDSR